jgi:CheY-like chemotaxis protein
MTPVPAPTGPAPILVVEDEALIRACIVLDFETAGFKVREAASADEAIATLENGIALSAVVTDLRMPGQVDGHFLVQWLAQHRPGLPVIVVSGCAVDLQHDLALCVAAVVTKPYDGSALVSMLHQLVSS